MVGRLSVLSTMTSAGSTRGVRGMMICGVGPVRSRTPRSAPWVVIIVVTAVSRRSWSSPGAETVQAMAAPSGTVMVGKEPVA